MIDLILQGTEANLAALLVARGLLVDNGDGTFTNALGFDWCWWAGTGRFPNSSGGFLAGFVALARIYDPADVISNPADAEQWSRSQVAKWIKNNGTLGTFGGLPCYAVANVRMMHPTDVIAWLAANNLPGHEWAGGNNL